MSRPSAAGALFLALLLGRAALAHAAPAPDPFYASLLRDGELLADQGKSAAAAKSLRIACFGLLEQPSVLARCLVRLGLAQAQSSDGGGFRQTFSRLLELESRTPSYATADLAPPIRSAFEEQLAQRIPSTILAASPTFQKLAREGNDSKDTKRSRKEAARAKAAPEAAGADVGAAPQSAAAPPGPRPTPPQVEPAAPAPAPAPAPAAQNPVQKPVSAAAPNAPASAPPVHPAPTTAPPAATAAAPAPPPPQLAPPSAPSAEESAALATARARMLSAKVAADLLAAADTARKVADAHPTSVEANALAGEIFYRSSRWQAAVLYLKRSGPPLGQPLLGFYLAVAQFESGDREGAATTLRPLLGKLQHTAYVQSYAQKILPP